MKTKFPRGEALLATTRLLELLSPHCERIAIAGSLRRMKPEVSDIELLFISSLGERPDGLFDRVRVDRTAERIEAMVKDGILAKRPNVNGEFTWGPKNKLAVHVASGIPVDLFSTTYDNWWTALVIRTGSKETNLALTAGANKQGATLMAYGCGVKWSDGTETRAESERHVFELCGVKYKEPEDR